MRRYASTGDMCGRKYCFPRIHSPEIGTEKVKQSFRAPLKPVINMSCFYFVGESVPFERKAITKECCPLAKASLICALLSIPLFGLPAIPGLILGFTAKKLIDTPFYRYEGEDIAMAGIIAGTMVLSGWGIYFLSII